VLGEYLAASEWKRRARSSGQHVPGATLNICGSSLIDSRRNCAGSRRNRVCAIRVTRGATAAVAKSAVISRQAQARRRVLVRPAPQPR
jgi:hypothetical protein